MGKGGVGITYKFNTHVIKSTAAADRAKKLRYKT